MDQTALPLDFEEPRAPHRLPGKGFREPSAPFRFTTMDSPVGELTLFGDATALSGVWTRSKRGDEPRPIPEGWAEDPSPFAEAERQLNAYFAGKLREFDLELAPVGTAWQRKVWTALTTIPYGETVSYGRLAQELGRPTASRAVGMANGRNPISIIVPCHRVIGADGALTGYAGGLDRKRFLLALES